MILHLSLMGIFLGAFTVHAGDVSSGGDQPLPYGASHMEIDTVLNDKTVRSGIGPMNEVIRLEKGEEGWLVTGTACTLTATVKWVTPPMEGEVPHCPIAQPKVTAVSECK